MSTGKRIIAERMNFQSNLESLTVKAGELKQMSLNYIVRARL